MSPSVFLRLLKLERHNETSVKTLTEIIKYLRQQLCMSCRCLSTPLLELFKTSKEILYEQVDCLFDRWCFFCCRVRNLARCASGNTRNRRTCC